MIVYKARRRTSTQLFSRFLGPDAGAGDADDPHGDDLSQRGSMERTWERERNEGETSVCQRGRQRGSQAVAVSSSNEGQKDVDVDVDVEVEVEGRDVMSG